MKKVIKKDASKKPMMQKGGVKKPLRKAQTGTATKTPFQEYLTIPGTNATDTVPSYSTFEKTNTYPTLKKAYELTYGNDFNSGVYEPHQINRFRGDNSGYSDMNNPQRAAYSKEVAAKAAAAKKAATKKKIGGAVKKMQTGGAKERAQKVIDQRKLENARKYAKMKQDKGLVPPPPPPSKMYKKGGTVQMAKGGAAHPGFKAVQAGIAAKQGVSKKAAGAILASATRKASAKAKAANPRLKRVKG